MVRRKGTVALVGLPPGAFPTPIFDVVLKRITIRGSIVGTRHDLDEAIAFAAEGKVSAHVETTTLECINTVLSELKAGQIEARMVLDLAVEHDQQSGRRTRPNANPERRTALA
jgi:alcohol dehydrogenase, propanol-preferring